VEKALVYGSRVCFARGDLAGAHSRLFNPRFLYSRSAWAARARWESALILMEQQRYPEVAHFLQALRNDFPDSLESRWALQVLPLIYRLMGMEAYQRYRIDQSFTLYNANGWRKPRSVRVAMDGRIIITDRNHGAVFIFEASGHLIDRVELAEVAQVTVTPAGEIIVSGGDRAMVVGGGWMTFNVPDKASTGGTVGSYASGYWAPDEGLKLPDSSSPGKKKPLEKVIKVAMTRSGVILAVSDDRDWVDIFESPRIRPFLTGRIYTPRLQQVDKPEVVEVDQLDRIFLLSRKVPPLRKEKAVTVFDGQGRHLKTLNKDTGAPTLEQPIDLAVDVAGNIMILDSKKPEIHVFSRSYRRLFSIPLDTLVKNPCSVAVGPDRSIYVVDEGQKSIIRLH